MMDGGGGDDARDFLPPVRALSATPASRSARSLALALCAACLAAFWWLWWGQLDIVAVAPGQVVPLGQRKVVQAAELAVVKSIQVREGQQVVANQVLLELDPTALLAERARLADQRGVLAVDRVRLSALLAGTGHRRREDGLDQADGLGREDGLGPADRLAFAQVAAQRGGTRVAASVARLAQERAEYQAVLAALDQDLLRQQAERRAAETRRAQLAASLPLVTEEAQAHRQLLAHGTVPRLQWLQFERARLLAEQELASQREALSALAAGAAALVARRQAAAAQFEARWLAELADTQARLAGVEAELVAVEHRLDLATLRAPVAGGVQQLAVHTVGGVVAPAQPLMVIVPDDAPLAVEAMIDNRDIGFVHPGQRVAIKVETYHFTRYGLLTGWVREVSQDAVMDAEHGRRHLAQIALTQRAMVVDGHQLPLTAGMAVTAELAIGRRRILDYLLSPLRRYQHEGAREP